MTDVDLEIDPEDLARVASVATADPMLGLIELAVLGGLDPARDLVGVDLRGWPLGGCDLRGFDLSGADLRRTGIERALCDATTILDGARVDRCARHLIGLAVAPLRRRRPAPDAYTKVRIPDLSDAELLDRDFVVRDPSALKNLVHEVPPTDQWLTYEGRYDVDQPVVCAFGHRHKKGYTFRDEAGRRYLVGNSCGAKHLGLGSWKVFAKGRQLLEERASYLRDVRDLENLFARNRDWIASLSSDPSIKAFDAARSMLQDEHPELVDAVRGVASDGWRLYVTEVERDFAAEERAREREAKEAEKRGVPASGERPIRTRRVLRHAGVLRGGAIFVGKGALRAELAHLTRFVDGFLTRTAVTTRHDLMTTTRNARSLLERLFTVIDAASDFPKFFDPANVGLFVSWADEKAFDRCRFDAETGRLIVRDHAGRRSNIETPPAPRFEQARLEDLAGAATKWRALATGRRRE